MGSMTSPSSCSVALRYLVRLHMGYPRTFPPAPNSLGKQGFVCTHLSTIGKKSLLERIAHSLNLNIKVEVKESENNS